MNISTIWRQYLLYTILRRTNAEHEHAMEIASFLDCIPRRWPTSVKSQVPFENDVLDECKVIVKKIVSENLDPAIKNALIADLGGIDSRCRVVIEKFLLNLLFSDAIISFCGFYSTILLHLKEGFHYPIDTIFEAFNDRAMGFFCTQLTLSEVKCFLSFCGDTLGLSESTVSATGWTYYMALWAVTRGDCSFWSGVE